LEGDSSSPAEQGLDRPPQPRNEETLWRFQMSWGTRTVSLHVSVDGLRTKCPCHILKSHTSADAFDQCEYMRRTDVQYSLRHPFSWGENCTNYVRGSVVATHGNKQCDMLLISIRKSDNSMKGGRRRAYKRVHSSSSIQSWSIHRHNRP
jgi:hypothetical protein